MIVGYSPRTGRMIGRAFCALEGGDFVCEDIRQAWTAPWDADAVYAAWPAPKTPDEMENLARAQLAHLRSLGHDGGGRFAIAVLTRDALVLHLRNAEATGIVTPRRPEKVMLGFPATGSSVAGAVREALVSSPHGLGQVRGVGSERVDCH